MNTLTKLLLLLSKFVTEKNFSRIIQIIMTLSVTDKVKMLPRLIEECKSLLPSGFSRTVRLLTRQSWLKTGLPPTAVNLLAKVNGHRTRQMLTILTITSGELCLNIKTKDISSQAKEHWWTEESLAVNTKPAAAGLNQQGHTELHKKTSSLCERRDGHLENALGHLECALGKTI